MSSKTPFDSPDVALMQALKFSSKDLDANRDGVLTASQKKRIWRWQFAASLPIWGLALLLAAPLTQIDLPAWRAEPAIWIWIALILIIIGSAFWFQWRTSRVLTVGKVANTQGMVRRTLIYGAKGGAYHYISTHQKEFRISYGLYSTFCDGEDYTLYYVPAIDYLLSAEHHPRPVPESTDASKPETKQPGKDF